MGLDMDRDPVLLAVQLLSKTKNLEKYYSQLFELKTVFEQQMSRNNESTGHQVSLGQCVASYVFDNWQKLLKLISDFVFHRPISMKCFEWIFIIAFSVTPGFRLLKKIP